MVPSSGKMVPKSPLLDLVIVGGGLSGLLVAHHMSRLLPSSNSSTTNWALLEARPVLGGRLANDQNSRQIDLGGAWFWPPYQTQMMSLVKQLNVQAFVQPDDPTSYRIEGGAVQLIHKIQEQLSSDCVRLDTAVTSCSLVGAFSDNDSDSNNGEQVVCLKTNNQQTMIFAKRVVFALPPRLLSMHVHFDPLLSPSKQRAMASSNTWMAGVTKVALEYSKKFWSSRDSNMGLPGGGGATQRPAFQVYDASTRDNSVIALTFFTLTTSALLLDDDALLARQCANQIKEMWKSMRRPQHVIDMAERYTAYHVKRWPLEKYLSEEENPKTIQPHPAVVAALSTNEWNDRLLFAGTETDQSSPGVMEGAIGAATRVASQLEQFFSSSCPTK